MCHICTYISMQRTNKFLPSCSFFFLFGCMLAQVLHVQTGANSKEGTITDDGVLDLVQGCRQLRYSAGG